MTVLALLHYATDRDDIHIIICPCVILKCPKCPIYFIWMFVPVTAAFNLVDTIIKLLNPRRVG